MAFSLFRSGSHLLTSNSWMRDSVLVGNPFRLVISLSAIFLVAALTIACLHYFPEYLDFILAIQTVLLVCGIYVIFNLARRVYRDVIMPIDSVRSWASRMRQGDYAAELTVPIQGEFAGLLHDLTEMGRWYKEVGLEGDEKVTGQVRQMARKTRLLEILYDIAATISAARDLDEVLIHFLDIAVEITHARSALVRLITVDGDMRLISAQGEKSDQYAERIALVDAIPGSVARVKSVYVISPGMSTDFNIFSEYAADLECLIVPLLHRGEVMGCYHLLIDQSKLSLSYDLHELLASIGFHLGLAVHKAQLDEETKQQSIFHERLMLAHELHDSLAQSIVSLKFQCKVLESSLQDGDIARAEKETGRLREGMERTNIELRELLAHFRAPIDQRGLIPVLTDMMRQFRKQNDVLVFSQFHGDEVNPPMHIQHQVVRIVQEALANVRKHAGARMVRLLLRLKPEGWGQLLLEDDGHGFEASADTATLTGKHIGLKVMQERAACIGAEFSLESEPGEGTRVELQFSWDA